MFACTRLAVLLLLAVGLGMIPAAVTSAAAPRPPNIVHIVADDLGWGDVRYHGVTSDVKPPNIDRLAATGTRLEQFYVQPLCPPTRACLMTGRSPLRYGLQSFVIPAS